MPCSSPGLCGGTGYGPAARMSRDTSYKRKRVGPVRLRNTFAGATCLSQERHRTEECGPAELVVYGREFARFVPPDLSDSLNGDPRRFWYRVWKFWARTTT